MREWLRLGVGASLNDVSMKVSSLTRGLVVVGQSGCGKSYLLGRLIEEIIRKTTDARLLVIDSNSDFCYGLRLNAQDAEKTGLIARLGQLRRQRDIREDDREFVSLKGLEEQRYKELEEKLGAANTQLIGMRAGELKPSVNWENCLESAWRFCQLVKGGECSSRYLWAFQSLLTLLKGKNGGSVTPQETVDAIMEVVNRLQKETSNGSSANGAQILPSGFVTIDIMLEILVDVLSCQGSQLYSEQSGKVGFPELLFPESSRVSIVELESITHRNWRTEFLSHVLFNLVKEQRDTMEKRREFDIAREASETEEENANAKVPNTDTCPPLPRPTFLVIDEAHNFAAAEHGSKSELALAEMIHSIGSEGRKYGLHLILATQRPNKLRRGLLGECDNALVMKMNSSEDLEFLARQMRILDVTMLKPCLHFKGKGNAVAAGEMTGTAPNPVHLAALPRRTTEGGMDIPLQ